MKLIKTFRDFSGGLSEVANDNMKNNELVEAVNIVPGDGYGIARTSGTDIAYSQGLPNSYCVRVIELTTETETQTLGFFTTDWTSESMYIWDNDVWEPVLDGETPVSLTPIKSWFIDAHVLYFLDGTKFQKYDGTSITDVTLEDAANSGNPPSSEFIALIDAAVSVVRRGDRWFYGSGDQFVYSEVGDPLKFKTTNLINVSTPDNETIKALWTLNEGILIFKKRTIHYFSGWDFANGTDLKLIQLNVTSGTEFPDTIRTIENGVLFLGNNGIYKLYVQYLSSLISAKNISDKKISNKLFSSPIKRARAIVFNNVYYLSIDSDTNKEFRYYIQQEAYYGPFTQGVYSYMPFLENSDKLYIGSSNGYVLYYNPSSYHYINTNTGEINDIPIVAKTKGFDVVGNMFQDSKVKKIFVGAKQYQAESTNLTVQIKADFSDTAYATEISSMEDVLRGSTSMWGFSFDDSLIYSEGEWGNEKWGWLETVTKEMTVGRKCKRLQFMFAGSYSEPLLIYGLGIVYKKKKVKGNRSGVNAADIVYSEE
jgi:hypothetical protein